MQALARRLVLLIIIVSLVNLLVFLHISPPPLPPQGAFKLKRSREPDVLCRHLSPLFVHDPARGHNEILSAMKINLEDLKRALQSHYERLEAVDRLKTLQARLGKGGNATGSTISYAEIARICGPEWKKTQDEQHAAVRVGVVTLCRNEEYTIAFVVAALLPHVDLYILIDTGSEDSTVDVVQHFFSEEIAAGKLIFHNRRIGTDVSSARNVALKILREQRCDYVLKVDADDVFYDKGASSLISLLKTAALPDIYMLWVSQYELVQSEVSETMPWLSSFNARNEGREQISPLFQMLTHISFGHDRVFRVDDTIHAKGQWLDESRGLRAENFYYAVRAKLSFFVSDTPVMAHYGWARPVNRLRLKLLLWDSWVPCCCRTMGRPEPQYGACEGSKCIDCRHVHSTGELEVHLQDRILRRFQGMSGNSTSYDGLPKFQRHPEVFGRMVKNVSEFLRIDREQKLLQHKRRIGGRCSNFSIILYDSLSGTDLKQPACIISMKDPEPRQQAKLLCDCFCNHSANRVVLVPKGLSEDNQSHEPWSSVSANTSQLFILLDDYSDLEQHMQDWIKPQTRGFDFMITMVICNAAVGEDEMLVNLMYMGWRLFTVRALAYDPTLGVCRALKFCWGSCLQLRKSF